MPIQSPRLVAPTTRFLNVTLIYRSLGRIVTANILRGIAFTNVPVLAAVAGNLSRSNVLLKSKDNLVRPEMPNSHFSIGE